MVRRRASRRSSGSARGTSSAHWLNLALYILVLVIVLIGLRSLGSGASSCFFEVAGPQQETPAGTGGEGQGSEALGSDAERHDASRKPGTDSTAGRAD